MDRTAEGEVGGVETYSPWFGISKEALNSSIYGLKHAELQHVHMLLVEQHTVEGKRCLG